MRFDFVYRQAAFNNEFGFFRVDGADGTIGSLPPDTRDTWPPPEDPTITPGYFAAAFDRATVVFPKGSLPATPDVVLPFNGGDHLVFFLVQNNTLANLIASNPNNVLEGSPIAFFSLDTLNPDDNDHLVAFRNVASELESQQYTQLAWEDIGPPGDFNDGVYNVRAEQVVVLPPEVNDRDHGYSQ